MSRALRESQGITSRYDLQKAIRPNAFNDALRTGGRIVINHSVCLITSSSVVESTMRRAREDLNVLARPNQKG